jgi:hypothetical protein
VIEIQMVARMARRLVVLGPALVGTLYLARGPRYAISGAIGIIMALANLWLSARVIGGVAERTPALLLPAGMAVFAAGLGLLTLTAILLQRADVVNLPVTGVVLVATHLVLVLWEAAGADTKAPNSVPAGASKARG